MGRKSRRKILATITKEDYIDIPDTPSAGFKPKSIAKFDFNKSLTDNGGTKGKLKIYQKSDDVAKIKVKQDLNGDGTFTKDELIYKGTVKDVEDMDGLINFEGEIKLKRYMSECEWEHLQNPGEPIACAEEYEPGYTKLSLANRGPQLSDQENDFNFLPDPPFFYLSNGRSAFA